MGEPGWVMVHSPLIGPTSWDPVADVLRRAGREVAVPSLVAAVLGPPPHYPALAAVVAAALPERPGADTGPSLGPGPVQPQVDGRAAAVLVVHSGAGGLIPAVVERAPERIAAVVFVDATLPYPGRSWMDTVPAEMAAKLRGMAGPGGLLPPWPDWFPPDALAALLPDPRTRAAFRADTPRLPLRFLEEPAPAPTGWRSLPCGYVQLSAGYDDEASEARRAGWPVTRLDGHHLSGVTDPGTVAAAIVDMANRL